MEYIITSQNKPNRQIVFFPTIPHFVVYPPKFVKMSTPTSLPNHDEIWIG